jgi:hypothetical protein
MASVVFLAESAVYYGAQLRLGGRVTESRRPSRDSGVQSPIYQAAFMALGVPYYRVQSLNVDSLRLA